MLLTYLMLFAALCLSAVAAFYSIVGLTAIFAAAVMPIIIMGTILEASKLVVTVWLHEYWDRCRFLMKLYLVPAVGMLMIITSMGIFGFLSKAHSDQSLVSGDVQAKIAVYDEKIKTAKDNIDTNRKALKQMDEAVDQVMGRSTDEKGADKAVAVRRSQQKERGRLLAEIEAEQKKISIISEERAPIAAEVRKVEAEVGPIKYIAALVYGDNPDANLLERAVRWVIIILVVVFDPLAIFMLLAATESLTWEKRKRPQENTNVASDDYVNTSSQEPDEHNVPHDVDEKPETQSTAIDNPIEEIPPRFEIIEDITVINKPDELIAADPAPDLSVYDNEQLVSKFDKMDLDLTHPKGRESHFSFGTTFPRYPSKGDSFARTNTLPTSLYKFTGEEWILVDKTVTDQYSYDQEYIEFLISKIGTGEYDPELLTDQERVQIEELVRKKL